MRKLITPFCAAALIYVGTYVGAAQDKSTASKESKEVQQNTKTMTSSNTAKTSADTIYGKVETYEPGKTLKVTIPGKVVSTKSFSLDSKDWTYNVAPSVKRGQWVTVSEKTDNNGHKTLTVEPSPNKGHAAREKGSSYK